MLVLMADDLATWLSDQIKERGWSMREVARRAGVSHTTIIKVVDGQVVPDVSTARGIARAFGVPAETVLRKAGILTDGSQVSGETELLMYFRLLDEKDQRRVLSVVRGFWEGSTGNDPTRKR